MDVFLCKVLCLAANGCLMMAVTHLKRELLFQKVLRTLTKEKTNGYRKKLNKQPSWGCSRNAFQHTMFLKDLKDQVRSSASIVYVLVSSGLSKMHKEIKCC